MLQRSSCDLLRNFSRLISWLFVASRNPAQRDVLT
jgi:hypothetical protein